MCQCNYCTVAKPHNINIIVQCVDSNFLGIEKELAISSQLQALNFDEALGISQMPPSGWGLGTRQLNEYHG